MKNKTILFVAAFVLLLSLAAAATFFTSPATVTEQTSNNYTIRINNTDNGPNANYTMVNVTLPLGFSLNASSNATNATAGYTFSFTTNATGATTLVWNDSRGLVGNNTQNANITFEFIAVANTSTIGPYSFIVRTNNGTTGNFSMLVNLTVNDTSAPYKVAFVSPSANGTSYSDLGIPINVTASDNYNVSIVRVYVYDVNGALINNTNITTSGATVYSYINITNATGLLEGLYNVTVRANDSVRNNVTGASQWVRLDRTNPVFTVTRDDATTDTKIVGIISLSDDASGVSNCGVNPGTITAGAGSANQTFELSSGIDCGETHSFLVTCSDVAGNTVSDTVNLRSAACESSSKGSSSGGGASSIATTWKQTFNDDSAFHGAGQIVRSFAANQRASFKLGNTQHHVGVKAVTATTATIEVASTPQTATFTIGQTQKFDVDADGFYDISVTLNSITSGKADVTIVSIHEAIASAAPAANSTASTQQQTTTATENQTNTPTAPATAKKSSHAWIWVVVLVVVVLVIWFVASRGKKDKKK